MIDKFKEKGIIESGTFHLKSGLISNTYINLKKIISYPNTTNVLNPVTGGEIKKNY